jgi:hypothetical protein
MKQWYIICAWCKKKVRKHNEETWRDIESVSQDELDNAHISHGICPECRAKLDRSPRRP